VKSEETEFNFTCNSMFTQFFKFYHLLQAKWEANIRWLLAKADSDDFAVNSGEIFLDCEVR
jgi:hypothetical protein